MTRLGGGGGCWEPFSRLKVQQPAEVEQGGHQRAVSSRPLAPRVASTLHHTAASVVSADVGNHQPSPLEWSGAHVVIVSPTPQTSALGAVGSSPPPVLTQPPKPFVCFFFSSVSFFFFGGEFSSSKIPTEHNAYSLC